MDHVRPDRLLEVADQNARFTEMEFVHMDSCDQCVNAFARLILQNARQRAQEKTITKVQPS